MTSCSLHDTLVMLGDGDRNRVEDPPSEAEVELAKAIQGGGSGRGMSYYGTAARCGRRARLSDEARARVEAAGNEALPHNKNALVIGSIYHLLQEIWRKPREGLTFDHTSSIMNVNVVEALRMFRGYKNLWGRDYWGRHIAVEYRIPQVPSQEEAIRKVIGQDVSGTMDLVVEMNEEDAVRAQRRLPGVTPGRYIVDFKTADKDSDGVALALGLQALWYPALWNWMQPDCPVDGIIFDIAMKRGQRKDRAMYVKDFQAVLVRLDGKSIDEVLALLNGLVRQATFNVTQDIPNRAECVDWQGKVCPYFQDTCDGLMRGDK